MTYTILSPTQLEGDIKLPASKSISNRALILNALAARQNATPVSSSNTSEGEADVDATAIRAATLKHLQNLADCDDTLVMTNALTQSGNIVDIGAAGTSMRFLTAFLAGQPGHWQITGTERMKNRPIRILVDALRELGAQISYAEKEGFPPLILEGKTLKGGCIEVDGSMSSQYLSALMMAAPCMENGLKLKIRGELISKPYFRMTLAMMEQWGVTAEWDYQQVYLKPQQYTPVSFCVESDWSAASYWYELLSLAEAGSVFLQGLKENSLQGDQRIAEWFETLGVQTTYETNGVRLTKIPVSANRFEADLTDQPDLAQTLVVTCAVKGIPFRLSGLQSLKIKETDRLKALVDECAKLGFVLTCIEDRILEWNGETTSMFAAPIDTYDDHRMAMAFAPVAAAYGVVRINHPEVVSKSYPNFWKDLEACGIQIDV